MNYFCLDKNPIEKLLFRKKFMSIPTILEEIKIITKVDLHASTVSLRSDGIIHLELHPVEELAVKDAWEIIKAIEGIGKGKKFPNLITAKDYVNIDKEAKVLSASEEGNQYTLADAIVVDSIALKLIANFYISFNKPVRPTRLFSSEEKAVAWLKTFL